jgi:hypothetical protein
MIESCSPYILLNLDFKIIKIGCIGVKCFTLVCELQKSLVPAPFFKLPIIHITELLNFLPWVTDLDSGIQQSEQLDPDPNKNGDVRYPNTTVMMII